MNTTSDTRMDLGKLDKAWEGFKIARGRIWTPGGTPYKPGEIEAIPLRRQQIANFERELETPKQLLL